MKITNKDLRKHKYSKNSLIKNIVNLNHKTILATQHLDADFCIKYILDMDINSGNEDSYIFDINYISSFQKHLSKEELISCYQNYYTSIINTTK